MWLTVVRLASYKKHVAISWSISETVYRQSSCSRLHTHAILSSFNVSLGQPEHGSFYVMLFPTLNLYPLIHRAFWHNIAFSKHITQARINFIAAYLLLPNKQQIIGGTSDLEGTLPSIIILLLLLFYWLECNKINTVLSMKPTKNTPQFCAQWLRTTCSMESM